MKYELFFFKTDNRELDIEDLFEYFEQKDYFKIVIEEDCAYIKYHNPFIQLDYSFIITKVSKVPDIYRLNPKYLDLDFYFSIDAIMPIFKIRLVCNIIEDLCSNFNLFIYNFLFNDVSVFSSNLIVKSYIRNRDIYKLKFPVEYSCLTYVNSTKLDGYFRYLLEADEIRAYFNNQYSFLPTNFVKNLISNKTYLVASMDLTKAVIIPPNTDLLYLKYDDCNHVYQFADIQNLIDKFLTDLPGFVSGTKVLEAKHLKKVKKIIVKSKLREVKEELSLIEMENLIDF